MKDTSFKHSATNKVAEIHAAIFQLEKLARDNTTEPLGVETRDLCQDLRCTIEMHDQKYALAMLPKVTSE